jgi:prefoldin subunit 5
MSYRRIFTRKTDQGGDDDEEDDHYHEHCKQLHNKQQRRHTMNRVFGKKKATGPAPSLDDAASGINARIDGMDGKIDGLEKELRDFKNKIKTCKTPAAKKQLQKRALEVLKRKRMYEKQRDMASAQAFNIDQTAFSLESSKATVSTVAAMKAANKELKNIIRKDLDINGVDELADEMAELMDDCELSGGVSACSFGAYSSARTRIAFSYMLFLFTSISQRDQRGIGSKLCDTRRYRRGRFRR